MLSVWRDLTVMAFRYHRFLDALLVYESAGEGEQRQLREGDWKLHIGNKYFQSNRYDCGIFTLRWMDLLSLQHDVSLCINLSN
jgi:hypothetical protein